MPWQNVTPMEEVIRFVSLAQTDRLTITDLCEQFGISRKIAYQHRDRTAPRSPHPFNNYRPSPVGFAAHALMRSIAPLFFSLIVAVAEKIY
jgi:hypothetical protein